MVVFERQVITIGSRLRCHSKNGKRPCPECNDYKFMILTGDVAVCSQCGTVQSADAGIEVEVTGMWYYRGRISERDHDLVLEVQYPDGSRIRDVYYHFDAI